MNDQDALTEQMATEFIESQRPMDGGSGSGLNSRVDSPAFGNMSGGGGGVGGGGNSGGNVSSQSRFISGILDCSWSCHQSFHRCL